MGRRVFLALGAVALLEGCAPDSVRHTTPAASSPTGLPGDSHPHQLRPEPSPTSDASAWQVPTPATPVSGVCPTVPGIVQKPGGPQFYLPCSGTNIALTIDDGPDQVWTPQILALLAQHNIAATFCMIGRKAAAHPDLVAAVAAGGHHIANHTFTHPNLPRLTPPEVRAEIDRATEAITRASGGHRPSLFRAPGGAWSPVVLDACTSQGMRPLDWSVDPRDWSRPGTQHIIEVILTKTRPGSIILEHDGGGNRQQTLDALRIALPRLIDAGYHFTQP
jgi:peptidoglycan/xylan/chitin deacetylase (PgdA/CDA1 family)